ncbi:unnamed protein product [Cylicocyclus nassatus]|uniref:Uncharacterized protein n=1 Tax=Cylicocyclus nassatus TaxID=53992 RepID=A0AA36M292_CYLNA|nr:unnamed protein product [Cylicocyclus nassatus]
MNNIVCSLTFTYDYNYCKIKNASFVRKVFAYFHQLPPYFQRMDEFCVISDNHTICFCQNACNSQTKLVLNALRKSYSSKYNIVYHRYNKTFNPSSQIYAYKILDCLLYEFGENSTLKKEIVIDAKRSNGQAAKDAMRQEKRKRFKRTSNEQPSENIEVLFWIIVAGAIAPILWLSIAYCVLISMENKRLMEELEEQIEGVQQQEGPAEQAEKPEQQMGGEKPGDEAAEAVEGAEGAIGGEKQVEPAVSPGAAAEDFFNIPQVPGVPEAPQAGQAGFTPAGPKTAKPKPERIRKSGKAAKTPPPKKMAKKSSKPKPKARAATSKTPKKAAKPKKPPPPRPPPKRRKK